MTFIHAIILGDMATSHDRILIVENDPVICDLVGRQALQAAGYQVYSTYNATDAIAKAIQLSPEVIIADISLPGLSGKDLLVALKAQGVTTPVIVLAPKGQEAAVIQTFRLGAADYLLWPAREAEIIAAVERLLKQSHERRERERLSRQLEQTNAELQMRVRELTTIFSIGKAVTTVIDQSALFEKILDGGATVTKADLGWFLLREENSKVFLLVAQRNLPASFGSQANQPLDDGISSLVAMSGEPLSIYGEPLRRFKVSSLGQSALIAPIKVQKQVIGMVVVMRKSAEPFSTSEQHLLEAVADYASISLVNARLFRAVEERARSLQILVETSQVTDKIGGEILQVTRKELAILLDSARATLARLMKDPAWWSNEQKGLLNSLRDALAQMEQAAVAISGPGERKTGGNNLKDLVRQCIGRLEAVARARDLSLVAQLPAESLVIAGQPEPVEYVLDGLVSNAIKYSKAGGQVMIRVEKSKPQEAHMTVTDCGAGVDPRQAARIFEKPAEKSSSSRAFGGIGIGLPLVAEIVSGLRGKIWVESKPEQGASFHVTLPLQI